MPAIYAPAVEALMDELASLIAAKATANAVTVGEVKVGTERVKDQSFQQGGIYVMVPDDLDAQFLAGAKREAAFDIPVHCVHKAYTDDSGWRGVLTLVGVVMDAVGADSTLGGRAKVALPVGATLEEGTTPMGASVYEAVVTVRAKMQHNMR